MSDDDDEVLDEIAVDEFDPGTRILRMRDGSLHLVLALMPPSWWDGHDALERLDLELAQAVGTDVEWADKELLIFEAPPPDAVERIRAGLAEVRRTYPRTAE